MIISLALIIIFSSLMYVFRNSALLSGRLGLTISYWLFCFFGAGIFSYFVITNSVELFGFVSVVSATATSMFLYQVFAVTVAYRAWKLRERSTIVNVLFFYGLLHNVIIMLYAAYMSIGPIIVSIPILYFLSSKTRQDYY